MSLFSSPYQTYYQAHKMSIDSTCLFIIYYFYQPLLFRGFFHEIFYFLFFCLVRSYIKNI